MSEIIGKAFGIREDFEATDAGYWEAAWMRRSHEEQELPLCANETERARALGAMYYCLARTAIAKKDRRWAKAWAFQVLCQLRSLYPSYRRQDIREERRRLLDALGINF